MQDKLSDRTCYMISNAFKTVGRHIDAYLMIEEDLYVHEAEIVLNFMQWVINNQIPVTERTMNDRFKDYKGTLD